MERVKGTAQADCCRARSGWQQEAQGRSPAPHCRGGGAANAEGPVGLLGLVFRAWRRFLVLNVEAPESVARNERSDPATMKGGAPLGVVQKRLVRILFSVENVASKVVPFGYHRVVKITLPISLKPKTLH